MLRSDPSHYCQSLLRFCRCGSLEGRDEGEGKGDGEGEACGRGAGRGGWSLAVRRDDAVHKSSVAGEMAR